MTKINGNNEKLSKYVQCLAKKNWTFWGFSYKMPIHARVENYLNVMINAPIFAQLFALMWGTIP